MQKTTSKKSNNSKNFEIFKILSKGWKFQSHSSIIIKIFWFEEIRSNPSNLVEMFQQKSTSITKSLNFHVCFAIFYEIGTSPSGANMQPWTYVVVKDSDVKG